MSFTAWIKGRVVPINSVLGLREILNNLSGSGTGGAITKADVGLGNVDNTSDLNKPVSTAQTAALALKLDAAIGFTALAANTTAINLASFAGKAGVQITFNDGLNKTITLDNDLKDGKERIISNINAHETTSILNTFPIPCITDSNGQINVPNLTRVYLSFFWHNLEEAWVLNWGGAMVKKVS